MLDGERHGVALLWMDLLRTGTASVVFFVPIGVPRNYPQLSGNWYYTDVLMHPIIHSRTKPQKPSPRKSLEKISTQTT